MPYCTLARLVPHLAVRIPNNLSRLPDWLTALRGIIFAFIFGIVIGMTSQPKTKPEGGCAQNPTTSAFGMGKLI